MRSIYLIGKVIGSNSLCQTLFESKECSQWLNAFSEGDRSNLKNNLENSIQFEAECKMVNHREKWITIIGKKFQELHVLHFLDTTLRKKKEIQMQVGNGRYQ